jgi:hypothetical protein
MSTIKHDFLLDLFSSEGFNVIYREGLPVNIGAIDTLTEHGHQIILGLRINKGLKPAMHGI